MVSMCNINKSFLVEAYIQITFFKKTLVTEELNVYLLPFFKMSVDPVCIN